ncbi:hypothetical protein ACFLW0_02660 [Chloroflexota bacterium]
MDNLIQVKDNDNNTTTMTYDWISRKTAMTDPDMGSWSYGYDNNGNLTSQTDASSNSVNMTYDARGRLIDEKRTVGSDNYTTQFTYDSADRLVSVIYPTGENVTQSYNGRGLLYSLSGSTASFVYDGDGNRVNKTENGETILYINRYYDKNLTTGNVTTYYYLGSRLVAMREGTELNYLHQDHLTGTTR